MAIKREQQLELIRFIGRSQRTGEQIKEFVKRKHWNFWQISILLSEMVNKGLLRVVGVLRGTTGNTYKKTYMATEAGMAFIDRHSDAPGDGESDVVQRVDTSGVEDRAKRVMPGRWVMLPAGVGHRQVVGLRDRGFEVRRVIRFVGEKAQGDDGA